MFAVSPKDGYRHYVSVSVYWRNRMASRVFYVPSSPMLAYYSNAFDGDAQRFGYCILKKAITKFTMMCFVCFDQAAGYGAVDLFWPACLRALAEEGRLRVNQEPFVSLPFETNANILKRGLLRTISKCVADLGAAILAFARAREIDWAMPVF